MNKIRVLLCVLPLVLPLPAHPTQQKLKVFISVDMEGLAGVVTNDQVTAGSADYHRFRRLMTEETNAAVAEEIPTVKRVNERTVRFQATEYLQGYRLFRVLYKYLQVN